MSECARAFLSIALAAPHLRVVLPQRSLLAFCPCKKISHAIAKRDGGLVLCWSLVKQDEARGKEHCGILSRGIGNPGNRKAMHAIARSK